MMGSNSRDVGAPSLRGLSPGDGEGSRPGKEV
jgi:hypothetical protein